MTPTFVTFLFMGERPRTLNSFEAAACPPPMDRKPRADARFISNTLLFQSWKMQDFSRATGSFRSGTGASKSNQGHFYCRHFQGVRHFLGKIDKSPLCRTFPVAFGKLLWNGHWAFAMSRLLHHYPVLLPFFLLYRTETDAANSQISSVIQWSWEIMWLVSWRVDRQVIQYDKTCQRPINIIYLVKTITLNNSAQNFFFFFFVEFFLKERSWRALSQHYKIPNFENGTFLTVADTLKRESYFDTKKTTNFIHFSRLFHHYLSTCGSMSFFADSYHFYFTDLSRYLFQHLLR